MINDAMIAILTSEERFDPPAAEFIKTATDARMAKFCRDELEAGRVPTPRTIAKHMGWANDRTISGRYVRIRTALLEEYGYTNPTGRRWIKA